MPSGISHMLLSRTLPIPANCSYRYKLRNNTRYFQVGSIAPDLPYASIADDNFLENESELADLFHFAKTGQDTTMSPNKLPLLGIQRVRDLIERSSDKRACDALFWFLMGYISHIVADGICHPYVMDKVGPYEGSNKASHRALEIGIDVLLFKRFTEASGYAIEASYAGMDTFIEGFNELRYVDFVLKDFSSLIGIAYAFKAESEEIRGWITGISRLFSLATGRWPGWLRKLDATLPYVFRQIGDLKSKEDEYLILKRPKYWERNFLNIPVVQFLNDCIPQFNRVMQPLLDKAYAYVYERGPEISGNDLQAFSLDTGRTVNDPNNIDLSPLLWEAR